MGFFNKANIMTQKKKQGQAHIIDDILNFLHWKVIKMLTQNIFFAPKAH